MKNKNKISKVAIKRKQSGGVVPVDNYQSETNYKILPKIYNSLASKYIKHQNVFSKNTMSEINHIIEKENKISVIRNRITTFLKNRNAISLYSEDEEGNIFFSHWTNDIPNFIVNGYDYKIKEEHNSLSLHTIKINFNNDKVEVKEKENGVIVNTHTIARIFQRLGYSASHIHIREQVDQIMYWYDSIYQIALRGDVASLSGVSFVTDSGVVSGTYILLKNKINGIYTPVFLARTFISEMIMNSSQSFAFKYTDYNKEEKRKNIIQQLHFGKTKEEEEALIDIKKIFELKEFFYSTDNLYERLDDLDKKAFIDKDIKNDIVKSINI